LFIVTLRDYHCSLVDTCCNRSVWLTFEYMLDKFIIIQLKQVTLCDKFLLSCCSRCSHDMLSLFTIHRSLLKLFIATSYNMAETEGATPSTFRRRLVDVWADADSTPLPHTATTVVDTIATKPMQGYENYCSLQGAQLEGTQKIPLKLHGSAYVTTTLFHATSEFSLEPVVAMGRRGVLVTIYCILKLYRHQCSCSILVFDVACVTD